MNVVPQARRLAPLWRCDILPLLLLVLCALLPVAPVAAQEPALAAPQASPEQVEAIIDTLEDPDARARLIEQLRLLQAAGAAAGTAAAAPVGSAEGLDPTSAPVVAETPVLVLQTATSALFEQLSGRVAEVGRGVIGVARSVEQLPRMLAWLRDQVEVPVSRQLWLEVAGNLALVLGLGYAAYLIVRVAIRRPQRTLNGWRGGGWPVRLLRLAGGLALDLCPVIAFALIAYAALGLLDLRYATRMVAVAWINASIIVRLALALGRFVLSPEHPGLRVLPLDDESAHYAQIWLRRLARIAVYGYFGLQAGLLLGLPWSAYEGLLRLLGLLVAMLLAVLLVQNREAVAKRIRGATTADSASGRFAQLRRRVASVWHILALVYVFMLYGIWSLDIDGGFAYMLRGTLLTLLVLGVARAVLAFLTRLFERTLRVDAPLQARFPGLDVRTNRYLPVVHGVLRVAVHVLGALALLQVWGIDSLAWLASDSGLLLGTRLGTIAFILVAAVVTWELASSFVESYLAETDRLGRVQVRSARVRTLLTVARNALLAVLSVLSTLLILSELGLNIAPLLAGAGVVGLAVGFGAQTLVKDIITGALILFQDLIAVGEVVKVGETAGLVEAISIRHVRLRDLTGTVHTIPFSAITTVSNLTRDFSFYVFDIGIAYREDADRVMDVLVDIGRELRADPAFAPHILADLEVLGVDGFADSAVIIKARIKTRPIQQWMVGREFNRRMKRRFDELGIEIPFPHRTLYFGADREGRAAPARVALDSTEVLSGAQIAALTGGETPPRSG